MLDEVRHEHVCGYLGATSYSDTEIAFLLGFGDPASFYRVFRAWTGMFPAVSAGERIVDLDLTRSYMLSV